LNAAALATSEFRGRPNAAFAEQFTSIEQKGRELHTHVAYLPFIQRSLSEAGETFLVLVGERESLMFKRHRDELRLRNMDGSLLNLKSTSRVTVKTKSRHAIAGPMSALCSRTLLKTLY
jgi:hypothetical protein